MPARPYPGLGPLAERTSVPGTGSPAGAASRVGPGGLRLCGQRIRHRTCVRETKLLDDLSQLLWKWRYLAKKVAYYGAQGDTERYDLARKQYDESVWDILNAFRAEISRSRRLVSERAYERLDSLYNYVVHDIDVKLSDLIRAEELTSKKSSEIAERFSVEVSKKLDDAIDDLASELHLKVKA